MLKKTTKWKSHTCSLHFKVRRFGIWNRFFDISSFDSVMEHLKFRIWDRVFNFVAKTILYRSCSIRIEFYVENNANKHIQMLFSWISRELENRHLSRFRSVVCWMLINCVQHNTIYVIKQYYVVRSTLLWPQVVAAPKGETRGVYGPCGPGTWFSAFSIMKKSRAEICQPRCLYICMYVCIHAYICVCMYMFVCMHVCDT